MKVGDIKFIVLFLFCIRKMSVLLWFFFLKEWFFIDLIRLMCFGMFFNDLFFLWREIVYCIL